jgi:16S rRNA (cytosine967-C5)-methyltransferase
MSQPHGIHARRAALQILDAVFRRGETVDWAQKAALRSVRKSEDKKLALAITNEVLRWATSLDLMIDSVTSHPLPKDAKARMVLRLMLCQVLILNTPAHAVIATGLHLLKGGPRRLAHGVFSKVLKQKQKLPVSPTLPAHVIDRWGPLKASEIARGLVEAPSVDLTLKDPSQTEIMAVNLGAESFAPGHLRISRGNIVESIDGFQEGEWWVQDLAASLPVRLLGNGDGRHALDMCAAPGGKTMQLSANGWQVTSLDISQSRLDLLRANLTRTNLKASLVRSDVLKWKPKYRYDAILLDAPCTATGTIRRHPDVVHRVQPHQITDLSVLQREMIRRAYDWLKPGGEFIYAVCSLEDEEGEQQAIWIDENFSLSPKPIEFTDLPLDITPTPKGWISVHPGMLGDEGGLDGFFVARWVKP